jgi:hypothetical protein
MKKLPVLAACILVAFVARHVLAEDWQEEKGTHFIVYYKDTEKDKNEEQKDPPKTFAGSILRKAEQRYKDSARDLGYQRASNFWTWDSRAKIYVYPTHDDYVKSTGHPKWTKGFARYDKKEVVGCRDNDREFLDAILPHEIGHLIFRDFIGFKSDVPLWLDEGVAQWQEEDKREIARKTARVLLDGGQLMSITSLVSIKDSTVLKEKIKDKKAITEFYVQSVSLIDFLFSKYGKDRFTAFCRGLRDGKTLEESLRSAYPSSISSLEDLEKEWIKYIRED